MSLGIENQLQEFLSIKEILKIVSVSVVALLQIRFSSFFYAEKFSALDFYSQHQICTTFTYKLIEIRETVN